MSDLAPVTPPERPPLDFATLRAATQCMVSAEVVLARANCVPNSTHPMGDRIHAKWRKRIEVKEIEANQACTAFAAALAVTESEVLRLRGELQAAQEDARLTPKERERLRHNWNAGFSFTDTCADIERIIAARVVGEPRPQENTP